jgi:predicted DNA-binding transcriptional regulator AlpA
MSSGCHNTPSSWPRLMRAKTAAKYVDERSVDAFRRAVGTLWPKPHRISGKGERWLREELDQAIDRATGRRKRIEDASDVL